MREVPERESLTVDLKSDRKRLPDADLVEAAVCLANTDGGEIYLGVEDDGSITGLHAAHDDLTGLAAMIANSTSPPLSVRVMRLEVEGKKVARIEVPRSTRLVATSRGLLQRRRLKADGTPECVPFYPHEFATRQSDLGLLDYSALPVQGAAASDFDPLERARLRQMVERFRGDTSLLGLADVDLDGALGLVRTSDGKRVPTVAGLLLLGTEAALRTHLPTHEVAFQVLDGTQVRVNDFYRAPLLKTFEKIAEQFKAGISHADVHLGRLHVRVPNYDPRAFHEAFMNALSHRDYTRLGAIHVRRESEAIVISNPGGFVEGVTLENLLVVEPRPRNPLLADALKRVGLAERTGRGVDLIYQGLLRYGRTPPDYSRSDSASVVVVIPGGEPDLGLLRIVLKAEERLGTTLPVESLIALSELHRQRRLDTAALARALQRSEPQARRVLETLMEAGLVDRREGKKDRTYSLSTTDADQGMVSESVLRIAPDLRQVGFNSLQEQMMKYVRQHGRITRATAAELCRISPAQASRVLRKLASSKELRLEGERRGAYYRLP